MDFIYDCILHFNLVMQKIILSCWLGLKSHFHRGMSLHVGRMSNVDHKNVGGEGQF